MRLFRRITDIVSANLNEMVDRFEDPETMLKQAVREMEQAVAESLDCAVKVVATEKLATRQLAKHRADAAHCQERARMALTTDDDKSARQAITRKIQHERIIAALEDQQATAAASSQKLRRQIEAMRVKLMEAKHQLATFTARSRVAQAQGRLAGLATGGDLTPFARFDRMYESVEFAEAEVEARLEFQDDDTWCEETVDSQVESALDAIKAELADSTSVNMG